MLSVLLRERAGYRFYYMLSDGAGEYGGGLTEAGEFVCEENCPQKELMLRTLVNKCMNDFIPEVRTRDVWGLPLERFGFSRAGEFFVSAWDKLKLPHDCGN